MSVICHWPHVPRQAEDCSPPGLSPASVLKLHDLLDVRSIEDRRRAYSIAGMAHGVPHVTAGADVRACVRAHFVRKMPMALAYVDSRARTPRRALGLTYAWAGFAIMWGFWICFVVSFCGFAMGGEVLTPGRRGQRRHR